MPDIVLTTLNAKYVHCAHSLRCLLANLGDLQARAEILEFVTRQPPATVADALLARQPRLLLFSVYIWNVRETLALLRVIRSRAPQVFLVLGGPEVSHPPLQPGLEEVADVLVQGEGELAARQVCTALLTGAPCPKQVQGEAPNLDTQILPYRFYTETDIANRIVYVESSRGCPYRCEYCLSSLDRKVRFFPLPALLAEFDALLDRGLLLFKFLDRTFNAQPDRALRILEFFLARDRPGLVLHGELVPDRLPPALKQCVQRFRPGVLQFEVGVQSFNQEVLDRIRRRQAAEQVEENLRWLLTASGAVVHTDLIWGLPGETLESLRESFDRLVALAPHQLQVNILKRLKGTPLVRHCGPFAMDFDPEPPFALRASSTLSAETLQDLTDRARVWTLFYNRGRFPRSVPLLWRGGRSAFDALAGFTEFVRTRCPQLYAIPFTVQTRLLFDALGRTGEARQALAKDYADGGRRIPPNFLRA